MKIVIFFFTFVLSYSNSLFAENISAKQAFILSTKMEGQTILVHFKIAPSAFLLANKLQIETNTQGIKLGQMRLPQQTEIEDPILGRIAVFKNDFDLRIPLIQNTKTASTFSFVVHYQGCLMQRDCFPPTQQTLWLSLKKPSQLSDAVKKTTIKPIPSLIESFNFGEDIDPILPVAKAYQFNAQTLDSHHIELNWRIADKTYLYMDKVKIEAIGDVIQIDDFELPKAYLKHDTIRPDGEIGDIEIYKNELNFILPLIRSKQKSHQIKLKVHYQGCADRGICYPPITKTVDLLLPTVEETIITSTKENQPKVINPITSIKPIQAVSKPVVEVNNEPDRILNILKTQNKMWSLFILYGLGILLAFTPCVFPMIPILSGIIAGQGEKVNTMRAFRLSLIYVLFMALTYAVVGVIAGLSGANLQAIFQEPWVIILFTLIFVALAFAMFDFYSLQLPSSWQSKLNNISNTQKSNYWGAGIMGILSALIVGPCITAPLLAILIYITQEGDAIFGGISLFVLGMGMGTPLLIIGTTAGKILPKAGAWMDKVKAAFGVMILGLAIYLLERIISATLTLFLWSALFIISSVYLGTFEAIDKTKSGWFKFWKGCGILLFIYGILMLIGVASDAKNTRQPLRNLFQSNGGYSNSTSVAKIEFKRIKTITDLKREIKLANAQGHPVMLDFYADWCAYCKQFENYTFFEPVVQQAFQKIKVVLLQADVTDNDAQDIELQSFLNVPAPPALLFFGLDGKEKKAYRLFEFKDAPTFAHYIEKVFMP